MTPERYQQLMALLEEALDLSPSARNALVMRVRSTDPALAGELELLLAASDTDCAALEPAAALSSGAAALASAAARRPDPLPDTEPSITGSRDAMAPFDELAGRYVLGERLGAGGAGVVYKALDQRTGQTVAVKLLSPSRLGDSNLQRFRREFRAISRLDHPGCLTVHEEGEQEGWRYIVMEYVAGGDLSSFIGADLRTILTILVQLASSLDYVHSRRIVHRDLKPANVLVARGEPPRPKLADFGIARMTGETLGKLTMTGVLIGTVDYLSPEQVLGEAATPRSDLYALGCMIMVLVSGKAPFEGSTFDRLVARTRSEAPRLASLAPGVNPAVDALVGRLLAREPMDRPQSALEVAHALADILASYGTSSLGAAEVADLLTPRAGGFLYAPSLAGREAERARVGAFLTARAGPRVLVVSAPAGVGKTTLVDTVARDHDAKHGLVVRAGLRGRATAPFAPFPELEHRLEVAGGHEAAAAPSLVRAPSAEAEDATLAPRRLARRLAARIEPLVSPSRPVLVILEDLHEADAGAIEVLSELTARLDTPQLDAARVLVTIRPEGRSMLDRVFVGSARSALELMELGPLAGAAIAGLAAEMLGCGQSALPPLLIEHLRAHAGGNPLLLQHRLRAIVHSGHLRRVVGGWELRRDAPTAPVLAPSALSLLRERLALLAPRTIAVLRAAAFIGRDFDVALLAAVAPQVDAASGVDGVLDALDEALRAGIVSDLGAEGGGSGPPSPGRDHWEFEHLGLVEALTLDVPPEEAARHHGAIGSALLSRPETPRAVLAHHLGRGPDAALAVHHLRLALSEALDAHDYAAARRHGADALARVRELNGPDQGPLEFAVAEALADAELALGSGERPRQLLERLLNLDGRPTDAAVRARLLRKLGRALFLTDQTRAGLDALQAALVALGDRDGTGRLRWLWLLGRDLVITACRRWLRRPPAPTAARREAVLIRRELATLNRWIDLERCARHVVAFLREAERLGEPRLLVDAWATWAFGLATVALPSLAATVEGRAERLALDTGDRPGLARLSLLRGGADVLVRGDFAQAIAKLDDAVTLADGVGDRVLIELAVSGRGWAHVMQGEWRKAGADFERALALGNELGVQWFVADARVGLAMVWMTFGRFAEAERAARQVIEAEATLGLPALVAVATEVLGGAAYMQGRYHDAIQGLEAARTLYERHHLERGWGFLVNVEHAEAMLWLADEQGVDAVPALVERLEDDARRAARHMGRLPLFEGFDTALWGVVAARRGQRDKALKLFEKAELERMPRASFLDTWMMVRIAFERLRLGAPRAEVTRRLDEVAALFDAGGIAGMTVWLARVRRVHGV